MLPATLNWDATVVGDDPDAQVASTIELMAKYVRQDAHTPEVEAEADQAAPPGTDPLDGIFTYVKRLIRFQRDETTAAPLESRIAAAGYDYPVVEVLIRPRDMVTWRQDGFGHQVGDCDDFAMLTAALLQARGIRANLATVAADPRVPGQYSHVYAVAYPGGVRVPMDTSHGDYPGWEAAGENVTRMEEWPTDSGLRGLLVAGAIIFILLANYFKRGRRTL